MWIFLIYVWWRSIRLLDRNIGWGAAFLTFSFVQRYIQIKFFSEFVASAVVISIAVFSLRWALQQIKTLLLLPA